jgi:cysteine-S-conjugate beta-lyase
MSRFDTVVDRRASYSTKWEKYRGSDVLPMWVADMDFETPQPIVQAIHRRADHGVFGYTEPPDELVEVFLTYLKRRFSWQVSKEELVFVPGVVPALNIACRGLLNLDEKALTATPVYYPFLDAPGNSGRELTRLPVDMADSRYRYPIDALRASIDSHSRMLLLCNPFNPLGRILDRKELTAVIDTCLTHDLLICSDEIHCELLLDETAHLPLATINPAIQDNLVTLMAPGKTFNTAGIGGSIAIISNPVLRERFVNASNGISGNVNLFAYEVMLAAYRDCNDWLEELICYLRGNRDYLSERMAGIPGISVNHVEATYLAWLDVRALQLDDAASFFEAAGVGLSDGAQFDGEGFLRLNFGCPRSVLETACDRMYSAVEKLAPSAS